MNYGKMTKILLLIALITSTSTACIPNMGMRNFTGVKGVPVTLGQKDAGFIPRRGYIRGLPDGDDSYSVGFRDGCQTMLGVVGTGTLRLLPERIDAERLSKDPMYLRGWHDGDGYCNDRIDWEGH